MTAISNITFAGTVITVLVAAGGVAMFLYLTDKNSRDYYKSLLEEWRRKGGGR